MGLKTPSTEDASYLAELAAWEAEWEATEKQLTLLRAKRKHVVTKRKYDYVLRYKGKLWVRFIDTRGMPSGYGWTQMASHSNNCVWRADTEKRAFWYAREIEKLKNILGIEVVPVEKK